MAKAKQELGTNDALMIAGTASRELAEKCPDDRVTYPIRPCTNLGCKFSIKEAGYMNCTFVAAEAGGEHTLEAVGDMMGITKEGVRVIEKRAIGKIRKALEKKDAYDSYVDTAGRKPSGPSGKDRISSEDEGLEPEDESGDLRAGHGGVLAGG